jgi:hypothetical protein
MDQMPLYMVGLLVVVLLAIVWSFVWDRHKPAAIKEFVAKLLARALFLALVYAILVSFVYLTVRLFVPPADS